MRTRNTIDIINNLTFQEIRHVLDYFSDDIFIMHQTGDGIDELEINKVIITGRIIEIHTSREILPSEELTLVYSTAKYLTE